MVLKKNLDVVIQEKLLDEIVCGQWIAGQALNLDDIAARFDVSRTPVQQALKKMHTLGMVTYSSKGHFSVVEFNEKQVRDICEVRLLLERQALLDIQRDQIQIDMPLLTKVCQECMEANQNNDLIQTRRTDLRFHLLLVSQVNNRCLSDLYEKVQGQFMVANFLMTSHTQTQQEVAAHQHEQLLKAIECQDFAEGCQILERHIEGACEKIVKRISG